MNSRLSWRYLTIAGLLGIIALLVVFEIIHVQTDPEVLKLVGRSDTVIRYYYPPRGEIFDRQGNLLAGNVKVYEVGVTLEAIKDPAAIASAARDFLGSDFEYVLSLLTTFPENTQYLRIADYVPAEQAQALMAEQELRDIADEEGGGDLEAYGFRAHLGRYYPENDLASNLLGYVGGEFGNFGVEEKYNNLMSGIPVGLVVPTNPRRAVELPDIPAGDSIILTIDRELQIAVQDILDEAIVEARAKSGTIVVMDPRTGEILAMATTPRMDLNHPELLDVIFPYNKDLGIVTPFNRAISQPYEVGSVFKVLTMAAAIDNGTVQPNDVFLDTGVFDNHGIPIYNYDFLPHGYQTMTGCLGLSLNVCLADVATRMGDAAFVSYMQSFGIGHLTGIDLAGEVSGRLKIEGDDDWSIYELANNSFGQGLSATPLQMVMAVSALANDGKMMLPHVLYATVQDGRQHIKSPQVVGTPISADTAHTLTMMLADAVEIETKRALVDGYRIAGKTGTAQVPDGNGYSETLTNASFVGWGPVDDPQFVVYVWLEEPDHEYPWGSVLAAPVFRQVVEKLVILRGIPPDEIRWQLAGQTGQ